MKHHYQKTSTQTNIFVSLNKQHSTAAYKNGDGKLGMNKKNRDWKWNWSSRFPSCLSLQPLLFPSLHCSLVTPPFNGCRHAYKYGFSLSPLSPLSLLPTKKSHSLSLSRKNQHFCFFWFSMSSFEMVAWKRRLEQNLCFCFSWEIQNFLSFSPTLTSANSRFCLRGVCVLEKTRDG